MCYDVFIRKHCYDRPLAYLGAVNDKLHGQYILITVVKMTFYAPNIHTVAQFNGQFYGRNFISTCFTWICHM